MSKPPFQLAFNALGKEYISQYAWFVLVHPSDFWGKLSPHDTMDDAPLSGRDRLPLFRITSLNPMPAADSTAGMGSTDECPYSECRSLGYGL